MTKEKILEQFRQAILGQETGTDYTAYNPDGGAYGAYQFQQPTWDGACGLAGLNEYKGVHPNDAPPEVQDQVAKALMGSYYDRYGGNIEYMAAAWYAGSPNTDSYYKNGYLPTAKEDGYPSIAEYASSIANRMGATGYSPIQEMHKEGLTPVGSPVAYYEALEKGELKTPDSKPLSFWEGVTSGFESSTFGQFVTQKYIEGNYGVHGAGGGGWTPSDSDFTYLDDMFKDSPDAYNAKYRIMSTAKSHDHMLALINYEQERQKREQRAADDDFFSIGTLGKFTGSLVNPINLIPMVGLGGRLATFAKAGFMGKVARASWIGVQNGAWNVVDEYGANKIGGTHFNPKEAFLMGTLAGTGLEMLGQFVGKGFRGIDNLHNVTRAAEESAATQVAGLKSIKTIETDISKVLSPADTINPHEAFNLPRSKNRQKAQELINSGKLSKIDVEEGTLSATMADEGKLKVVTKKSAEKIANKMGFELHPKTKAMYLKNSDMVIAIKDNIRDAKDLDKVVLHEYGVHRGFELMGKRERTEIFDYVTNKIKNPKGVWREAMQRSKSRDPEEVLAHFIELGGLEKDKRLGKLKRYARQGMRKAGLGGVDDAYIKDFVQEMTWREVSKKRGYSITPDGGAVIDGVKFSVDNPIHPHNYEKYIATIDEINKMNNQSEITRLLKASKYIGSDYGKASNSPSLTLQKVAAECFRDIYQGGKNNALNAEHVREIVLGRLQTYDEGVRKIRSEWMGKKDVIKRLPGVGHDALIREFDSNVIRYYDSVYGSLTTKKNIQVDPEIKQAAALLHDKHGVLIDELQHSADYLGLDISNIISKNFSQFDEGFSRRIDARKHTDFINDPIWGGDIEEAKKWLSKYGKLMACRKIEANRLRLASRRKVAPDEISEKELMDFIDDEASKWALGCIDQDASNLDKWLLDGNKVLENRNPLDFLNDRFIGDSSLELELPDGRLFSFDNNLRDFRLDVLTRHQTNRTAGEVAFRSKFKNDDEFVKVRSQIRSELEYAKQGVVDGKGLTKLTDEDIDDIMTAFDTMMSKLRGRPITKNIFLQGNSLANDIVGMMAKAAYTTSGNNIGISSLAEMIQSIATNGTEILPRIADYATKGTDLNGMKDLVEVFHMKDMTAHLDARMLNGEEFTMKYGNKLSAQAGDKLSAGLNACGRVTNFLNQLPRLTESWTNLLKASSMKDFVDGAYGKEHGMFYNPYDAGYLREAGIATKEQLNKLNKDIRKYFPNGKANREMYLNWRKESPSTFMQFTKLTEDAALRGMTRSTIGNTNTAFKSNALGKFAAFFMNFTFMASHSQFLRLMNRPLQDKLLATAFSLIGGLASYIAYTTIMAETKYALDKKKKEEYYKKRFNPTMFITAALTRGAALAPTAYGQNALEVFGMTPSTVRTTVGGNNEKVKSSGDLVGNVVNQMPIANTLYNMGASFYNLGDAATYKVTEGKYGSTINEREFNTLLQSLPAANFFGTQLIFEAMKKEFHLPKKEKKGTKSSK